MSNRTIDNPEKYTAAVMGSPAESSNWLQRLSTMGIHGHPRKEEFADLVIVVGPGRLQSIASLLSLRNSPKKYVVVVCSEGEDTRPFVQAGADDVLWKEATDSSHCFRIERGFVSLYQKRKLGEVTRLQRALLKMRSAIASRGDGVEVLREILCLAGDLLHCDRVSIMAHLDSSRSAYVLAATDDPTLSQFELAIEDYPEVREAIRSGVPLLIEDVRTHPVTEEVSDVLVARDVLALAVFPVSWKGRSMGALLFRKNRLGMNLSEHEQSFGILMAAQLAAQLRDSSLFERMRDQTRRLTRAGYDAQRRAKVITSLSEYFEASTEGVIVVDQEGEIVFANGSASSLTGFATDTLLGTMIYDLLPAHQKEKMEALSDAVFDGRGTEPADFKLKTTSDKNITVSVTTSTVLSSHGAVILSFRDVSEQRSLEKQLQHSNEFLSNLIDSAVDAIIAVDPHGDVILFNTGAEQLFGYKANEVVGKRNVSALYPEGVPRQVMRMLRSQAYGGVGRLEQIRREVIIRSGELVPVNMTASVIYDKGEEVATVGIFSDLRDRLRIEQRLLRAQEQLKEQEQRSLLTKLAGAAAHELNQPLTSIMGYAQLINRTATSEGPHTRYSNTIVQEAERMAEIVKKIGRITHYETVPYVGSASIVDLDRSVEASESAPVPVLIFDDDEPTGSITLEQIADSHEEEMRAEVGGNVASSTAEET